jgi:hypothetical protein
MKFALTILSRERTTVSHKILLYLREKYLIFYVLIVIRIYCKIMISWNTMTIGFTDMYHCFRGMGCHHLQGNNMGVPHWWWRQQLPQKPLVHGYHIMWHHNPEYCNLDVVAVYCTTEETYWCHCLPSTVMAERGEGEGCNYYGMLQHFTSKVKLPCTWWLRLIWRHYCRAIAIS